VSPRAWAAPVPPGERRRLAALMACAVLDTDPEPEFDDLTAMVAEACDAPVALFNLIDRDRQWSKARVGFATPELPRDVAFCPHALASSDLLVIPDARLDPRFADNPLVVGEPYVRFYAGAPLELAGGERVGVLCVLDGRPREGRRARDWRRARDGRRAREGAALAAAGTLLRDGRGRRGG